MDSIREIPLVMACDHHSQSISYGTIRSDDYAPPSWNGSDGYTEHLITDLGFDLKKKKYNTGIPRIYVF